MKKIMIFSNELGIIYKFRLELLEKLIEFNDIYIVSPVNINDFYFNELKKMKLKIIPLFFYRRNKNILEEFKIFFMYLKIIKKFKPNIVLTYTIKPNLYGNLACRILKIPSIMTITGIGEALYKDNFLSKVLFKIYKISSKKVKCIFFQNQDMYKLFLDKKIINGNFERVNGSGVNLDKFCFEDYQIIKEKINFIFIGRIMEVKGINELLEVFKKLKEENRNVNLTILGRIEEEKYRKILEKYNEKRIINYIGEVTNVTDYLKQSHCLVHTGHSEGMSNVMLEAAAIGLPLIASNIPGCKEIIENGKNGYTFEVKNIEDLYNKILKFTNLSFEEKKEMGKYSRKKVENEFDRQIIVNKYLKYIMEE